MAMQGFPLAWAERHCLTAVAQGLSLDELFEQALIRPRFGDSRDRISAPQLTLLYYNANLATDDESRRNGRGRVPVGLGAIAIRAMFGCLTLESGLEAIVRLYDLVGSSIRMKLLVDHDEARFVAYCSDAATGADPVSLEDAYVGFLFMCCSHFVGRPLRLLSVDTPDPTHMNLGGVHWATRSPVRVCELSALRFPKALLQAPRAPDRPKALFTGIFDDWLDFVEGGPTPPPLLESPLEALQVGRLAAAAGVSSATLRRRMDRLDGGFRRVREGALVSAGLSLLVNTADSVESIAAQIGYSDARSFRRFIKSATGRTPLEWRDDSAAFIRADPAVRERIREFALAMSN